VFCDETAERLENKKQPEGELLEAEVFAANQRMIISAEIARWRSFNDKELVIMDRGPETTEFFTLHYSEFKEANFDSEQLLSDELRSLRECRSSLLLYLTASPDQLFSRADADAKPRPTFSRWLHFFEPKAASWFRQFPSCQHIDTTHRSPEAIKTLAFDMILNALMQFNAEDLNAI